MTALSTNQHSRNTHTHTHRSTHKRKGPLTLLQVQWQWRVQWVQRALIRAQVAAKSVSHITRTAIKSAAVLKKWMRAWVRLQMVHNCNSWAKPTVSISPVLLGCLTPNNFYILYRATATHSGLKPRVQTFMWMLINTKHLPRQTALKFIWDPTPYKLLRNNLGNVIQSIQLASNMPEPNLIILHDLWLKTRSLKWSKWFKTIFGWALWVRKHPI